MASQPVAVVCRVLGAPRSSIYARRASAGARGRRKPRPHDGTIIPDLPNQRWGTDATMAWTRSDGWVWVFACVDHYSAEAWAHVAKVGDRFAALQPVHDAVIDRWGRLDADIARGLGLRHDWGPQICPRTRALFTRSAERARVPLALVEAIQQSEARRVGQVPDAELRSVQHHTAARQPVGKAQESA